MKFDASPPLTKGKCVSYSSPSGWGKGGDHPTPKSEAKPAVPEKIVNTGTDSSKWAEGGDGHMVGKQHVKNQIPGKPTGGS